MAKRKNKDEFMNEDINLVVEDKPKNDLKKESLKTETCKVLWSRNKKIAIDFKGYGVIIEGETDKKVIEVQYKSQIGKSDFKIYLV